MLALKLLSAKTWIILLFQYKLSKEISSVTLLKYLGIQLVFVYIGREILNALEPNEIH